MGPSSVRGARSDLRVLVDELDARRSSRRMRRGAGGLRQSNNIITSHLELRNRAAKIRLLPDAKGEIS
jgi:hypothetical protein